MRCTARRRSAQAPGRPASSLQTRSRPRSCASSINRLPRCTRTRRTRSWHSGTFRTSTSSNAPPGCLKGATTEDAEVWHWCSKIGVNDGCAAPRAEVQVKDVAVWLRDLGLERYESLFRDHKIDWDVLPKLTSEDLKEIGVLPIGHRRRLLHAIATFGSNLPPAAAPAAAPGESAQVGERRQLTVMFCDLVGSTALASRLDPEDLREVIGAYQKCVADVIDRFDGFVAKYLGAGVLAYFGYPQAHADDAERAVRASLAAVKEVRRVASAQALQVRIGLATGVAVVGDLIGSGAAQEQAVIGDTPNLAARLQALAGPNEILIPENTRRLVGSLFEYDGLGQVEIRGLATPVAAFRVVRESQPGSRFEALRTDETPLVGRAEELELLHRRWAQAKAGNGQVVLISADPGVGKSRLAEAFHQSLEGEPHTRLGYFS